MNTRGDNRRRFLSDVVSLDAWHSPIRLDRNTTQVSVELTFKEGRMGGDDEDLPFTFLLALKRATLRVIVEEPLVIDRRSIARDVPLTQGEQTVIKSVRDSARGDLSAGVSLDVTRFSAAAKANGSVSIDKQKEDSIKFVQSLPRIMAVGEPAGSQEYRWILDATFQEYLIGQPWDPVANPRMSAKYDPAKVVRLEPAITVDLVCMLEDLAVSNITPKDSSLANKLKSRVVGDSRIAAANHYLKRLLISSDLEAGRMDNRFASLVIGSVLSSAEAD